MQAEGDHHRPLGRGTVQPSHEDPLDQRAGDRGPDHQDEHQGDQHRCTWWAGRELPVAERGDHPDRALGEVEHSRGGVGHHQTGGGDRVAGTEHDAEHGVLKETAHRIALIPPASRSGARGLSSRLRTSAASRTE